MVCIINDIYATNGRDIHEVLVVICGNGDEWNFDND